MTLNGITAAILRYFTDFDSFGSQLYSSQTTREDVPIGPNQKHVHVCDFLLVDIY